MTDTDPTPPEQCPKCGHDVYPIRDCAMYTFSPDAGKTESVRVHIPDGMECLRTQNATLRKSLDASDADAFAKAIKDNADLGNLVPRADYDRLRDLCKRLVERTPYTPCLDTGFGYARCAYCGRGNDEDPAHDEDCVWLIASETGDET